MVKNIFLLFTSTLFAQIILFLASPILTRLYTPQEFGTFAIFANLLMVLVVISSLRYEQAILLPRKDIDIYPIILISLFFNIIIFFILLIIVNLFNTELVGFIGNQEISDWLYVLPFALLIAGLNRLLVYTSIRFKKFKLNANTKVLQALVNIFLSISVGLIEYEYNGMIIGIIIGYTIASIYIFIQLRYSIPMSKNCIIAKTVSQAKKYKKFPINSAMPSLMDSLTFFIPILFLTKYFSIEITGYFSLAIKMVYLPLVLISTSVSQVLLAELTELYKNNKILLPIVLKTLKIMFLIGIVPTSLLFLFGEQLFIFIFGEEWQMSGYFVEILIIGFFFRYLISPLSSIFTATNSIHIASKWQMTYFATTAILFFMLTYIDDIGRILISYALHEAVMYLIYLYFIIKKSKGKKCVE
jgi:O-antigen/teichoic acid export membrane protein